MKPTSKLNKNLASPQTAMLTQARTRVNHPHFRIHLLGVSALILLLAGCAAHKPSAHHSGAFPSSTTTPSETAISAPLAPSTPMTPAQIAEIRQQSVDIDFDKLLEFKDIHPLFVEFPNDPQYRLRLTYKFHDQVLGEETMLFKPGHWNIVEMENVRKYRFIIAPTNRRDKYIFGFYTEYTYDNQGNLMLFSGQSRIIDAALNTIPDPLHPVLAINPGSLLEVSTTAIPNQPKDVNYNLLFSYLITIEKVPVSSPQPAE